MNSNDPKQWKSCIIAEDSEVKLLKGGTLPVGYKAEHFKHQYIDEYTGEVLPQELIHAAIVDELNYFNNRVREITTKADMANFKDHAFVRCRWTRP